MYSREERMTTIELYIKYEKCAADVIRELGYTCRHLLPRLGGACPVDFYIKS
ncbi:MAG: hypothetical protein PHI24_12325 [Desulfitobacteriaceae bacterium]|jgi:putative transposase|nr:hypothetical protein [Desulfitobacteriaceae bacterium]